MFQTLISVQYGLVDECRVCVLHSGVNLCVYNKHCQTLLLNAAHGRSILPLAYPLMRVDWYMIKRTGGEKNRIINATKFYRS